MRATCTAPRSHCLSAQAAIPGFRRSCGWPQPLASHQRNCLTESRSGSPRLGRSTDRVTVPSESVTTEGVSPGVPRRVQHGGHGSPVLVRRPKRGGHAWRPGTSRGVAARAVAFREADKTKVPNRALVAVDTSARRAERPSRRYGRLSAGWRRLGSQPRSRSDSTATHRRVWTVRRRNIQPPCGSDDG
jgi:hypothetical protein